MGPTFEDPEHEVPDEEEIEAYDAISGKRLDPTLCKQARKDEMKYMHELGLECACQSRSVSPRRGASRYR